MPRLLILLLFAWANQAQASETYGWTMPSAEEQLARDTTVIPVGMGAVFIPTITGPEREPPAALVSEDEVISVAPGARYLLKPGAYVVVVSSGSPAQGISAAIDVKEGETTMVPVTWGALRIEVTNDRRIPHRGSYAIIRSDTREPIGTGFGADTLQGEILQTWVLKPGLYKITQISGNYRSLTDYATVFVPESGFVRFRLVQDEDTQEFLAAGVLLPDEFASGGRQHARWFHNMVIGLDGNMTQSRNVVGANNQMQLGLTGFLDAQLAYHHGDHRLTFLAQAEEGFSQIRPQDADPQPLVKATDRLRADVLYTFALRGSTGPYARASAQSQAFSTDLLVTEDTDFTTVNLDESTDDTFVAANETFHISDPFAPTLLREGVGINTNFLQKKQSMSFNFRAGFGMRQNLYQGALQVNPDDATQYFVVDSFYEQGIESTVLAQVRLPGWVVYSTDLELFAPFETLEEPAFTWRNNLSFRLTRNLSLNYFANFVYEPQVFDTVEEEEDLTFSEKIQQQQSLLLRASWTVF